jgi:predicted NAD-dependent protein-ADP-ribosyltransferase YbiA (DUF1768 family)
MQYEPGIQVIPFYACGSKPYHRLSNFALVEEGIFFDGLMYCSTEHAFQAQKYIQEQRHRFSIAGDLGCPNGFSLVFGDDWEKKRTYWMKKQNIGIIAKMATNITVGKKLGLQRDETFVSNEALWIDLLMRKFTLPAFRELLQSTHHAYLLEFDRGAKRCEQQFGKSSFWGGLIEDNILYGNNAMGKYIMVVREHVRDN